MGGRIFEKQNNTNFFVETEQKSDLNIAHYLGKVDEAFVFNDEKLDKGTCLEVWHHSAQ